MNRQRQPPTAPALSTKTLLRFHRYAGLVAAPLVLFFAISGTWQVFRLQQTPKDGSYEAPKALSVASDVHMAEHLKNAGVAGTVFQYVISAVALILAASTIAGMVVAVRVTRPRWMAIVLLLLGAAVPPLLYALAMRGVS